jgi:diguanylate cyclase (GGDEF)-like protein
MESLSNWKPAITLLYVEDDDKTQEHVTQILKLKFSQITLLLAQNGLDGLNLYSKHRPAIVVTDVRMPIIDGIQMAMKIKELNNDAQIIVLSATDDANYILEAINIGINNYILKPIDMGKFIAAIERCLERINLIEQIRQKDEYILRMAYYDYLTGLPNRQMFNELLHKSLANAQRNKRLLSILFLDLDEFKYINDTLGHSVGDHLLKEVAERLKNCCCRDQDTVARWGGDEFIILLPDIDGPHEAVSVAQKIIVAFAQAINMKNNELTVSISIGISLYPEDGDDGVTLIKHADFAMFCAKNKGRNQFHYSANRDNDKFHKEIPCSIDRLPEFDCCIIFNEMDKYE